MLLRKRTIFLFCGLLVMVVLLVACGGNSSNGKTLQTTVEFTANPSQISTETDPLATQIDQHMLDDHKDFSGTILVAKQSDDLIILSYGFSDRDNEVPNTSQTKYPIGSITKSFTAMAIMILEERGLLKVEDPICNYLSDCPDAWKPVTLHHLLNHSSGIPNYADLYAQGKIDADPCTEHTQEEIIACFKDYPLEFPPGSQWHYSNSGYYLLGIIIEKVSDKHYDDFIQENILKPLEMTDTGYNFADQTLKNRASGYSIGQLQIINAPCWDVSVGYSSHGLYSTVGDLYKWDQAFYKDPLVSDETLGKILTSVVATNDGDQKYGYGWFISSSSGRQVIEHHGGWSGFNLTLARYPDDQVTVVVLSNLDVLDVYEIGRELAAIVFEEQ